MVNSRSKGKRGELEWAKWLRDNMGCQEARRGQQFKGTPDSPDVEGGIPGTHAEVKRVEKLNIYDAIDKAVEDAGNDVPYVAHRRDRKDWLLTVRAGDVARLANCINRHQEQLIILRLLREIVFTDNNCERWLNSPCSHFGDKTPQQVIDSGCALDVMEYLIATKDGHGS